MANKVIVISFSFFIFHLLLACFVELIDDEAYYNFWASSISLGYYDHPPMIAWWIYLGKAIFGSTTLGVRFLSTFSYFIVSILVGRIAFLVGDKNDVTLSVLLLNITMPIMGLGFISTPDAPLLLFWTCALWSTLEGLSRNNPWYWLLVGIFTALAILSKYNALFFILGLFGWCVFTKKGRMELYGPFVWIGTLTGLLFLSPTIFWNYKNDWIGLEKQFGRLLNETIGMSFLYEFLVSIAIFSTPLLFTFSLFGLFKSHQYRKLLLWVYLPSFLYFLYHSLTERIQGNWMIIFFPWLAVLAAVGLQNVHHFWNKLTIFIGSFITLSVLILGLNPQYVIFSGDNPFNQMKGWSSVEAEFRSHIDNAEWVAVSEYAMIGRLAWLYGSNKKIWALNEPFRYFFRSDFPQELCGKPGIFIEKFQNETIGGKFVEATSSPEQYLIRRVGSKEIMSYKITSFSKVIGGAYCH